MRKIKTLLVAGLIGTMLVPLGSGCNTGTQIPLADVPPAPAQDPSLRKKTPAPPGSSPDDLVYPSSN